METLINELKKEIDQFNQLVDGLKMQNKRLHGKINNLEEELDLVSIQRDSLAENLGAIKEENEDLEYRVAELQLMSP